MAQTPTPPYDFVVKDQDRTHGIMKFDNTFMTHIPQIDGNGSLDMNGADITVNTLNYTTLNPPINALISDTLHYSNYLSGSPTTFQNTNSILNKASYEVLHLSQGHTVNPNAAPVSNASLTIINEPTAITPSNGVTSRTYGYYGYSARNDGYITSLVLNYADELSYNSAATSIPTLDIIILHDPTKPIPNDPTMYTASTIPAVTYTYYIYKEKITISNANGSTGVSAILNLQKNINFNIGDIIMVAVKQEISSTSTVNGHIHASLSCVYI